MSPLFLHGRKVRPTYKVKTLRKDMHRCVQTLLKICKSFLLYKSVSAVKSRLVYR